MAAALARGTRITGTERQELATRLGERYAGGESIRAIAEDTGRSFGFVHGLVKESGVAVRGRGGATRGATAGATATRSPSSSSAQQASENKSTGKPPTDEKSAKNKRDKRGSAKGVEGKAKGKKSKGGGGKDQKKAGKGRS